MMRLAALVTIVAVLAALDCGDAQAQARGPTAEQIRETGQEVLSRWARLQREMQAEEQQDDAARAARLAELGEFLRRLVGRFRIDGQITGQGGGDRPTGVADCEEVGEGVGVNCVIYANWSFFENPPFTQVALPPAEALNSMRPAVLLLGLNHYPLGIRSMLVPADSIVFSWVGRLHENTLRSNDVPERLGIPPQIVVDLGIGLPDDVRETMLDPRLPEYPDLPGATAPLSDAPGGIPGDEAGTIIEKTILAEDPADCTDRCLRWFDVIARPESNIVTLEFQDALVSIKFLLHRDPEAQAEEKMRVLKAR